MNIQDAFKDTPLLAAVDNEKLMMAETLLKAGARMDIQSFGETPLYKAMTKGVTMVQLFLRYGATLQERTSEGETLLHLAVYESPLEVVQFLLESGLDVNATDNNGNTPLDALQQYKDSPLPDRIAVAEVLKTRMAKKSDESNRH